MNIERMYNLKDNITHAELTDMGICPRRLHYEKY